MSRSHIHFQKHNTYPARYIKDWVLNFVNAIKFILLIIFSVH